MTFNKERQEDIDRILDWSIDMEKVEKNISPFLNEYREQNITLEEREKTFLLGTTNFDQNHNLWKKLSQCLNQWKGYITFEKVNNKMKDIIDCIVYNKPMKF